MNHLKKIHIDDNGDHLLACWCLLQVVLSLKASKECFQMFQWEISTVQKQYAGDMQRCTWMVSLLVVCDTALCAAGTGLLAPPGGRSCRTTCIITQTSYHSTRKEEEVNQERQLTTSKEKSNNKYDPQRIYKYEQKTRKQCKSDSVAIHLYMNKRFNKTESLSLSWSRHSSPCVQPGGAVSQKCVCNQVNIVHSMTTHLFTTHFNIILTTKLRFLETGLPGIPTEILYTFLIFLDVLY